ncbi:MAG TPA: hypothetical protein VG817_09155, partial [Gemmatimonadales bacterium]|nr:hypothetical protein [Gemmatimonadales bacterium]
MAGHDPDTDGVVAERESHIRRWTIMTKVHSRRTAIGSAAVGALLAAAGIAGLPAAVKAQRAVASSQPKATYVARLSALNTNVTRSSATGEARFTIRGDSLSITVNARGLPKDIEHWQHF